MYFRKERKEEGEKMNREKEIQMGLVEITW